PSYTADTLDQLAGETPGAELFLVLGQDALVDLPNWKDPPRILRAATLALAGRPGSAYTAEGAREVPADRVETVDMPRVDISSTLVRERVRAGLPFEAFLPAAVAAYVRSQGLYR
ncbi:MAG: nicotinic acid mononucleotide adenylyltransferase, partial [Dehalococcoidia bacterium]|nr:nicotinic acid mononucleotide adenylyltransferase [Dehalococcoidia bacterium]